MASCDHDVAVLVSGEEDLLTTRTGYDGQPTPSPDGSTMAYVSVFDDGIDIVLRDLNSGSEERLEVDGWDVLPRWEPEGGLIYSSDVDGDREIYVRDVESGVAKRLTDNDADDHHASFSPDGSQVVFVRGWLGEEGLWLMDADGTEQRRIKGSHAEALWPAWSPDGTQVVYVSGGVPYIIDVAGGEPFRIPIEQIRVVESPSWSPGPEILFSADGDVWSVAPDGTALTRVTATASVEEMAVRDGDGSIVYQGWHSSDESLRVMTLR